MSFVHSFRSSVRSPVRSFVRFFSKLRTAVYPSNMAPIGAKLWQNAFQTICNFLFFDAVFFLDLFFCKIFGARFFFEKVRFWRSYEFQYVIGTFVVKSYCPKWVYFWGDFLGEGVNDSICVENVDLAPKMTSTIWRYDVMIISSDEMLI